MEKQVWAVGLYGDRANEYASILRVADFKGVTITDGKITIESHNPKRVHDARAVIVEYSNQK